MSAQPEDRSPELVRGLGLWDSVLLVVGSVIGTGIFITGGDMARVLPHGGLLLLAWLVGGLLTLAGALTYAEMGAMLPRAGGIFDFLKAAYGPFPAFLYGWSCFLVIFSGGIAAIAVGFAEYLGAFVPACSTANVLWRVSVAGLDWQLTGGQLAAAAAILFLTIVNWFGVRQGAVVGNVLTALKVGAVVVFVAVALTLPARVPTMVMAPLPGHGSLVGFGLAMVAVLWTFDGWYGLTFSAAEMRDPGRHLPRGLIWGTLICAALYLLLNFAYLRALSVAEIAGTPRVGEAAASALLGAGGARALSAAIVVSAFGCLASTILYSARLYLAMARDGLFFASLGRVHPRFRTPGRSLWVQGVWAALLTVSGRYDQLYTYVIFVAVLFHVAAGAAVLVLRRTRPEAIRPYRTWGYPVVPLLFILGCLILLANTLAERPTESLLGLGLLALGLPAYAYWRRGASHG
jgi:basic amino acid/polyamine antiporter, APA family